MDFAQQIADCQTPKLGYTEAHADAGRRLKAGERQQYCGACMRWQWAHQQCPLFRRSPEIEKAQKKGGRPLQ